MSPTRIRGAENAHRTTDRRTKLILNYVTRGRSLRCGRLDDSFQPRDVFQQTPSGQNKEVVAELRILKVDFKQPVISYAQDLPVFDALDRPGSSVIGRKEVKVASELEALLKVLGNPSTAQRFACPPMLRLQ